MSVLGTLFRLAGNEEVANKIDDPYGAIPIRKAQLEERRAQRQFELDQVRRQREMQRRQQEALGGMAGQLSQRFGIPQEQISDLISSGAGLQQIGALGSLLQKPKQNLVEVFDPKSGGMVRVPESQAVGMFSQAPIKRRIIEQDGIQYFADTGQPVVSSPIAPKKPELTEAEKQVDKEFGKEYVELQAKGGMADIDKQLDQLKEAKAGLESGANLTGALINMTPDFLLAGINPEALSTRELVEEVAQRNLRSVLGAQFAEKEGERLIKRAYNPALSEAENAKRVGRLITQMERAAESKKSAIDHYERNGTLKGWKGEMPTMSDFDLSKETKKDEKTDSLTKEEQAELQRLRKKYGR